MTSTNPTTTTTAMDTSPPATSLKETAEHIGHLLRTRKPCWVEGVPPELYPLPPFVNRDEWAALGDLLRAAERPNLQEIPGNKWFSLRCDGTGFGKFVRRMQKDEIWTPKYSPEFAEAMKTACQKLMTKFARSVCGYTQSDELAVLIPPASIVRGEQQCHDYNGRLQKLCSQAASTVTSAFVAAVIATASDPEKQQKAIAILQEMTPTFDCRVGMYETEIEAVSLLLWRAYDCGVNSTSDTVHKSGLPGSRKVVGLTSDERLLWLTKNNLLPLPTHQRVGTLYLKPKKMFEGVNQKTGQPVTYYRTKIEPVEGNVLDIYKEGRLVLTRDDDSDSSKKSRKKQKKNKGEGEIGSGRGSFTPE